MDASRVGPGEVPRWNFRGRTMTIADALDVADRAAAGLTTGPITTRRAAVLLARRVRELEQQET